MSLFKKKKPMTKINFSTLARNTIYDTGMSEPEMALNKMGISPISDEVSDMERLASESRLERVSLLEPILLIQAQLIASALATLYLSENSDFSEELVQTLTDSYRKVAVSASIAAMATCIDMNLLETKGL